VSPSVRSTLVAAPVLVAFLALAAFLAVSFPKREAAHLRGQLATKALAVGALAAHDVTAGFEFEDREGVVDAITAATRKHKVRSLTAQGDLVKRGVSIGVIIHGGRLRIVVNLESSKAEGMRLSSKLLAMAIVID
jgi:hypothetical protein